MNLCSSNSNKINAQKEDYKIAFNVLYDGGNDNYEIFIMNADGSGQTNISNNEGVDWVYHSHGDRLYFISDRDSTSRKYYLYEMKWDGTEVRKMTDYLVHDSYMSSRNNGTEFLISKNIEQDSTRRDLFIIDLEGTILSRVTDDEYINTDAYFSPDGQQIVFRSYRDEFDELYIINADGTELRRLTHYPEDDSTAMDWEYHAGPPQWVDSETISFLSKRNGNYSIYSISPVGDNLTQLTPDETPDGYPSNEGWHSWSKDGKRIVYNATEWDGNFNIYKMDADGSNPTRLTNDKLYQQAPVFVYPNIEDSE